MEKRGLLYTHKEVVTLGITNCMQNVTHYQFDVLFGYLREKWALENVNGLLQGLGKTLNLETTETHKYLKKSFYVGDPIVINLYVQSVEEASFILSADFIHSGTQFVHTTMSQKIVSTDTSGKICRLPEALKQSFLSKLV